ncbi:pentapeptide repeat-containing protein [Streptomyces sp. NPDC058252]|uniref:pentapeptide repeat-containing protein n=1 Tax=Streptomyces sp. NPDC058252 TaxID=3346405 RepID=UPI0036E7C42E
MPVVGPWQWTLVSVLVILGSTFAVEAWRMAVKMREREPRIGVLSAIGGGLVTGLAVGLAIMFFQKSWEKAQQYAAWKAGVEVAQAIPGFTPGNRDIKGINFSGKDLRDADLRNADLRGAELRDTVLRGAVLDGAHLENANLIGADLTHTSLKGAHLEGASLHSADLTHADIKSTTFHDVKVNPLTCWPTDVSAYVLHQVEVQPFKDENGVWLTEEFDGKDHVAGGQLAPKCEGLPPKH